MAHIRYIHYIQERNGDLRCQALVAITLLGLCSGAEEKAKLEIRARPGAR